MIKGILFDKDGTLIDFFALWETAARKVIPRLLLELKILVTEELTEAVLDSIGVYPTGIDPKGALAYQSYHGNAERIKTCLQYYSIEKQTEEIEALLERLFYEETTKEEAQIIGLADLKALFGTIRQRQIKIGVATADTEESTRYCLARLGVLEDLDYMGTDDGRNRPKPAPDMLLQFCETCNLRPEEVLVVGDTANDLLFAKNAHAMFCGVLSGVSEEKDYEGKADWILPSIAELPEALL